MSRSRRALALALLSAAGAPAQAAGALPPARACELVLWAGAGAAPDAAALAAVRALGFTAVNLPRGGDPARLAAAGLRYYLDQPAGKGVFELRDAEWLPLLSAYERTRDPAGLVRPGCPTQPTVLEAACAAAAAETARTAGPSLAFVALTDEASWTRHNNPLDLCRCPQCRAAFAGFLRGRYRTITDLNSAWGSEFADFDAVVALSTDQVRRRELGGMLLPANLRPWSEHLEFVDARFAAAVGAFAARAAAAVPGVPIGLSGVQPPSAFGGHDYAQLLPGLSFAEVYDLGAARELAACFLPAGAMQGVTLSRPKNGDLRLPVAELCDAALHGLSAVIVWDHGAVLARDGPTDYGRAVQAAFAAMAPVLDACAGAVLDRSDLWVVESQASVRAGWMIDSAPDGMTWVRRFASYDVAHGLSFSARASWLRLFEDLGLQPRFVAERELPERLLQQRPRCLALPACWSLADRTCAAIAAYVRAGGTVLADHGTALYDEHLVLRQAGALDALFGITTRSLRFEDLLVRQGRSVAGAVLPTGAAAAEAATRGQLSERHGEREVFIERADGRGRAVYLNLAVCDYAAVRLDAAAIAMARDLRARVRRVLQLAGVEPPLEVRGEGLPTCLERAVLRRQDRVVLALRVNALDRPELLRELGGGKRPITLSLRSPRHLRRVGGADLGTNDTFALELDPYAGLFLEEVRK